MTEIIVLRWPDRSACLIDQKFRSSRVLKTVGRVDEGVPQEWLEKADEVRILIGSSVIFRTVTLEGGHLDDLLEAAKYSVEPTLPLPLSELTVAAFLAGKSGSQREIMVTAISERTFSEVAAWADKVTARESAAKIPITWAGSPLAAIKPQGDMRVKGEAWAAIAEKGRWIRAQSARAGSDAAAALDKTASWTASIPDDECIAAASAREGSWIKQVATPRARLTKHLPVVAVAVAFVFLLTAFGIRIAAAEQRIKAADRMITETFTAALPGVRQNMPREQIMARLKESRERHDVLRDRIEKKGSALEILMIIEKAAELPTATDSDAKPTATLLINDLRVASEDFTIVGSAASVDRAQSFVQKIKASLDLFAAGATVEEPDVRRSPAGLGFDYTIRGSLGK